VVEAEETSVGHAETTVTNHSHSNQIYP